jgi:hypothetical protein
MRALPLAAVLVAAFLAVVPATARASLGTSMEAPPWTPGDFWTYRFNTTFEHTVFLNGTVRAEVLALRNVTVRGVAQDAYIVDTTGSGTLDGAFGFGPLRIPARGSWNLTGEETFAAASRVVLRSLLDITGAGRIDLLNAPFTLHWINTTESRVVRDSWTYPVPLGFRGEVRLNTSWAEDVFVRIDQNDTTMNRTGLSESGPAVSLADRTGDVTVPAGPFEVFMVNETWPDGSRERHDYAPAAGNDARTASYNASGGEVARTELLAYRYRASEPGGTFPALAVAAVGAAAAVLVVVAAWVLRRRRAREERYTPPSLRDPPAT